jgi:hypothetical protein
MTKPFVLAVVLAGLLVSACGEIPHPFKGTGGRADPFANIRDLGAVEVEYVDGPAVPMARLLAQAVADELANRNIAASAGGPGTGHFLLKSKTRTNQDSNSPVIVFIDWTLLDKERRQIGTYTQEVKGTWWEWVNGDPKIIRAVGLDTGKTVAAMLQDPGEVAAAKPSAKGVRVKAVEGAPGDGNQSLAAAMKTALLTAQVPMAEQTGELLAEVKGLVELSPPDKKAQQTVRITWSVLRPDGSVAGEAQQENAVPAGSLDGPWGRVAGLAATAATDGIKQILNRIEEENISGQSKPAATAEQPAPVAAAETPKAPEPEKTPAPPPAETPKAAPGRKAAAIKAMSEAPREPARGTDAHVAAIGAGPRIQLASLRSAEQAAKEWKRLQEAHPAILAGLEYHVEEADLGERGIFYRVQAGPFGSRSEAMASCDALKQLSVACIVAGR